MKYLFSFLLLILSLFMYTASAQEMQQRDMLNEVHSGDAFYTEAIKPIRFTKSGMQSFMCNVFNNPEYCENILPYNFSHLIQFLQFGRMDRQDIAYMISIMRLFNNKLKSMRYITANAFCDMMATFPDIIESYCVGQKSMDSFICLHNKFNAFFVKVFTEQFNFFKEEPIAFFEDVSDSLLDIVEEEIDRENLKQMTLRFLENAIGKIIWCPIDQEEVWNVTKDISGEFYRLYERKIIDEDELDDLYKSLLEQFCYFLELSGSELAPHVLDRIKEDIIHGKIHLLELDEQEEFLEPKKNRLIRALMMTQAKICARKQGIITEEVCVAKKTDQ